jgi:Protein of unknown function (DUF3102)
MTETLKQSTGAGLKLHTATVPITRGELVVIPQSLAELTSAIRAGHSEVERALVNAVAAAISIGAALRKAKKLVGHGNFEEYVSVECRFSLRAAQNYMKLAKHEAKLAEMLTAKNAGRSYLTIGMALKVIDGLRKKRP